MKKEPKLIVIQGPTASGKTKIAVELANYLNTVVISADSRQFYKEISIGTAKPSVEEMAGVKHYFIDSHLLIDEVSAARFATEAKELILKELSHLEYIIIVGGSGLFIQALCEGLDAIPHDLNLQNQLTEEWKSNGLTAFLEELKNKDPDYFQLIDKENPLRVIRAIEAIRLSGKTMTELRSGNAKTGFDSVFYFTTDLPREELYKRINDRVDHMLELGLENEARSVFKLKHLKSLQTVGYRELFDFFDGKISREGAIDLIKQHSRNYAKRQITWFKSHNQGTLISMEQVDIDQIIYSIK
ncbi:MAG: tRNA (adenosine(37)-N6)-dimethylallyltransferase MiaA [Bacteroidota bacterium]